MNEWKAFMRNKPCIRCGDCCKSEVCPMGEAVYKTTIIPCPGLQYNGKKSSCELMGLMNAEGFAIMSFKMGIGAGCTNDYKYEDVDMLYK